MDDKKLNIFDFIKLILNNKLKLLITITLFLLIGLIFSNFVKPTYKGRITIHPLSLVEFKNIYVSENTILGGRIEVNTDEISLKQISPLTLFYSFLNTLKKEKHNLEMKNLEIEWNFLGGQQELYLIGKSKDYKDILNNFTKILKNSDTLVLDKIIINLEKEIKLLNIVNEQIDTDNQYITLRKIILKKNLNYLSESRPNIINYEIKESSITRNLPENHTILIISIILGIFFGIIYILYGSYFNGQKK
jgi:LPS O-antigen subunit length determinant protein (WzzB/FepE family)